MKKYFTSIACIMLCLISVFALSACGKEANTTPKTDSDTPTTYTASVVRSNVEIYEGQAISVSELFSVSSYQIKFNSSNTSVATVSSGTFAGTYIFGHSAGTTKISTTNAATNVEASVTVKSLPSTFDNAAYTNQGYESRSLITPMANINMQMELKENNVLHISYNQFTVRRTYQDAEPVDVTFDAFDSDIECKISGSSDSGSALILIDEVKLVPIDANGNFVMVRIQFDSNDFSIEKITMFLKKDSQIAAFNFNIAA